MTRFSVEVHDEEITGRRVRQEVLCNTLGLGITSYLAVASYITFALIGEYLLLMKC